MTAAELHEWARRYLERLELETKLADLRHDIKGLRDGRQDLRRRKEKLTARVRELDYQRNRRNVAKARTFHWIRTAGLVLPGQEAQVAA
jgi:uncharacterized membrane protein